MEFSAEKINFSKLPHKTRKIDFLAENSTQKTLKNAQIEVVGPKLLSSLYDYIIQGVSGFTFSSGVSGARDDVQIFEKTRGRYFF